MAQLKNTTLDSTGFLQLPNGTTGQRPSPAGGQFRFNTTTGLTEFYNASIGEWIKTTPLDVVASGGNATYDTLVNGTTYRVHVFTSTGNSNFTVTKGGEVDYLIVGAGGGGGGHMNGGWYNDPGGGGGAGGLLEGSTTVTPQTYTITVGAGGTSRSDAVANNGGNSSAFGVTATGGGGGGAGAANSNVSQRQGQSGGSGGGSGGPANQTTVLNGGNGTAGQGNRGGSGGDSSPQHQISGGGGGAGFEGEEAEFTNDRSGVGGIGKLTDITGISTYFAGGGGGGGSNQSGMSSTGQIGGLGGGGRGGDLAATSSTATDGVPNSGGGGGGAGGNTSTAAYAGKNGGDGIVVIRYPLRQEGAGAALQNLADALVLDMDMAKPTVYPGTGSVIKDSRMNGIQGNLNSNSYVSRGSHRAALTFGGNGVNNEIHVPAVNMNTTAGQGNTIEQVVYARSPNDSSGHMTFVFWNIDLDLWYYQNNFGINNGASLRYGIGNADAVFLDKWVHLIVYIPYNWATDAAGASADVKMWLNGTQQTLGVQGGTFANKTIASTQDISIGGGYTNGSDSFNWKGEIALTKIYNRELTNEEAVARFNSVRWRFGL